jgi:hypothetical protein
VKLTFWYDVGNAASINRDSSASTANRDAAETAEDADFGWGPDGETGDRRT